jgi:phosphate transport system permease protein
MSEPNVDDPPLLTPSPASTPPRSGSEGAAPAVLDASRAWVDRALVAVGGAAACVVGIALVGVAVSVLQLSMPSIRQLGFGFVLGREWDPVHGDLGALPFLYGTIVTALGALLLAVPVAIGVALFLTDLGPPALRRPVAALVELLAAVPGVASPAHHHRARARGACRVPALVPRPEAGRRPARGIAGARGDDPSHHRVDVA